MKIRAKIALVLLVCMLAVIIIVYGNYTKITNGTVALQTWETEESGLEKNSDSTKYDEADSSSKVTNDDKYKIIQNNEEKLVAITFDDGPSVYTDEILDVLEKYNVKATFFVVGSRVSEYAEQLKREDVMGCEIGSHTYTHRYLTCLSTEQIQQEIDKTNSEVFNVTGHETTCIRPPGGFYNDTVINLVNCPITMWSVDTLDWKTKNPESVIKIATSDIQNGDIILMHDLYSTTVQAVEQIVPSLVEQGYKLVTVSELFKSTGGVYSGKVYYSMNHIK